MRGLSGVRFVVLLVVCCWLAACGEKAAPKQEAAGKEEAGKEASEAEAAEVEKGTLPEAVEAAAAAKRPTSDLRALLRQAAAYVPDGPMALAVADVHALDSLLTGVFPVTMVEIPEEELEALYDELLTYHKSKLGFGVKTVHGLVGFVTPQGDGGLLVRADVEVAADGPEARTLEGHRLLPTALGDDVTVFFIDGFGLGVYGRTKTPVAAYLKDAAARKGADAARLEPLLARLPEAGPALFAVDMDFASPLIAQNWPADAPVKRPERARVVVSGTRIRLEVEAEPAVLESIESLIEMGRGQAKAGLAMMRAKVDELDVAQGTAVIVGNRLFDPVFQQLRPKREGNRMVMAVDFNMWGAMPVVGILAAVAVPAFIKYMRKAKTAEAVMELDKLARAAGTYYCTEHVDREGKLLPPHFPASQAATPAQTCCRALGGPDADGDDRCDPNLDAWMAPTWSALHFAIPEPHRFVYEVTSNGKPGAGAEVVLSAYGDLDCDGIRSTFQRMVKGSWDGEHCSTDATALYIENETE